MGNRRIDIERLPGNPLLFLGWRITQGEHVVLPVSQLDEYHAHVRDHGQQHLADALHLAQFRRAKYAYLRRRRAKARHTASSYRAAVRQEYVLLPRGARGRAPRTRVLAPDASPQRKQKRVAAERGPRRGDFGAPVRPIRQSAPGVLVRLRRPCWRPQVEAAGRIYRL